MIASRDWGTILRFGLLQAIDRWPSIMLGTAGVSVPAKAAAYAKSRGWL